MPQKLKIPDRYAATLAELVRLTPEELAALLGVIREEQPTLALTDLIESIADRLSIDRKRMSQVVRSLADLQTVREGFGLSVNDFVSELHSALEATGKEDLHPRDWAAFESAIMEALAGENALSISSKAQNLLSDYQRVYCSGRILTDFRPVFKSNIEKEPAVFVIVHTLKVIYHENEEHREFFISLDCADLERLNVLIERALKKEGSLKDLATAKNLLVLEAKP